MRKVICNLCTRCYRGKGSEESERRKGDWGEGRGNACHKDQASHADVLRGSSRVSSPTSGGNAWRNPKDVCVGG